MPSPQDRSPPLCGSSAFSGATKPGVPCSHRKQSHPKAASIDTLLANLSETLASANAMLNDLAFGLEGSRRHVALGVAQMIELGTLLANKALDRVELRV
ncbi:DUF6124 family protein [Pseudomonas sp. G166]|uniref:DUF6124 family protein n=1 Tax=Pseudomonas sp. G166 TaxID=3094846 RepID=UPI003008D894